MTEILEIAALVALLRRHDRPWHHYADLVEETGTAIGVLRGEVELLCCDAPTLFDARGSEWEAELEAAAGDVEAWVREGLQIVTVLEERYPPNLRTVHNRPPILFLRGEIHPSDQQSIAVVGTRDPSKGGLNDAYKAARDLVEAGFAVVSGLAHGIDTAAHSAALDSGGRTVAIIGTGIRRVYPASNADLQEQIARRGVVASQFWPDAPPTRTSFPLRNIVMSGFALATVVIEAGDTSGARMQARFALEHGRPVFLLRRLLEYKWARSYVDRPGTFVVDSAADVASHVDRLQSIDRLTA